MKRYFLVGLVTLLPLAVTIWFVKFVVNLLTNPFMGIISIWTSRLPPEMYSIIRPLSQIIILIALFLFIWTLGFVARKFFFHQLLSLGDKLLVKIPLVNKVYKTTKEIVKSLFSGKENSFQQVVMVPFPYQGSYCIGLITKKAPDTCENKEKKELVSVFIPTTPNPSTGFLVMSPLSDLIFLKMKPDEAIKYAVSCGVIQPEGDEK